MSVLPITLPPELKRKRGGWRGLLLLVVTVLALLALYYGLAAPGAETQQITQTQLFDLIKVNRVRSIVNEPDPSSGVRYLVGWYVKSSSGSADSPTALVAFRVPVDLQFDPHLLDELRQAGYSGTIETVYNTNIIWPIVINFLPIILFVGLMYLLFRKALKMKASTPAPPAPPAQ